MLTSRRDFRRLKLVATPELSNVLTEAGTLGDDAAKERRAWVRRPRASSQVIGVYVALLVMWIVLTIASPFFLTVQNVRSLLIAASTLSLVGAGLTIVLIAGEIDLSFAAMQAFVGSIVALLVIKVGMPWPLAILVGLSCGTFAGVVSGLVSVIARLPTFITTLAMLGIVQGTAFLLTNGQPVTGFPVAYQVIGTGRVGPVPLAIAVVVVFYVLLYFMLNHTVFGLHIYAVGGNRAASNVVGINSNRIVVGVLALSAFLASVSGVIITSRLGAGSGNYGAEDLLPAVAAVIIGGTSLNGGVGSLLGTFGGVMIIVTINDGLVLLNVSQFWQQVVVGIIIMGAVLIDQAARGYLSSGWLDRVRGGQERRIGASK
ncbi:MAG: ABC transporter permease [Chloroflexi bacterium]|nr:ABC transporter permease [Chloroflexota bacterium]MBV9596418.1 ABC transporter permease [Chloroflexota bacterium]